MSVYNLQDAQSGVPLPVSSVQLPAQEIRTGAGGVTYFTIDVVSLPGTGTTWKVNRRYNEFLQLKKVLNKLLHKSRNRRYGQLPFFPGKEWFCTGARLEERRRALEYYLRCAVSHPLSGTVLKPHLWQFLMADYGLGPPVGQQQQQQVLPVAQPSHALPIAPQALPVAQPALALPLQSGPLAQALPIAPAVAPSTNRAPAQAASSAPQTQPVTEIHQMEIELPPSVGGGAEIDIVVPDGRQVPFRVPVGTPAGSQINIWFNSLTGTFSDSHGVADPLSTPKIGQTGGDAGQVVSVQVPRHLQAGQLLNVQAPSGSILAVTMPFGLTAGSQLELWYDSSNDSLRPISR
jgi:hypothetical protein